MNILNRLRWVFIRSQFKEAEPRALKMERIVASLNKKPLLKTLFKSLRFSARTHLEQLSTLFRRT